MTRVKTENPLKQVLRFGQSLWYDGLVSPQDFEKLVSEDGIRGATTNPTIFEKALSSHEYDVQIRKALASGRRPEEVYQDLAVRAVQGVADVFDPVYQKTDGLDGYVSIEVSPLLARDTEGTLREARELHALVSRKNIMIKVPATREGVPAIHRLIAEGINVNVTLIFSAERYREVMEAYLGGLEERAEAGKSVHNVASVASFFVSRVDTAVDGLIQKKSDAIPHLKTLFGKAAIANSKIAYKEFESFFSGTRFKALESKGARKQRPLWASTGTKNPDYSDVFYVEALIGPESVDTMPPATMDAYRDHGQPALKIRDGVQEAARVLQELEKAGVSLKGVTQELEEAGVRSFSDSYEKILKGIEAKR